MLQLHVKMFRTGMGMQAWLEQLHNKVIDYNCNYFDIVITSAVSITGFINSIVNTFLFNLDYIHDYIVWVCRLQDF